VEGDIPFRYLDVPLNYVKLYSLDWKEDEEKRHMFGRVEKILMEEALYYLNLVFVLFIFI
jgi:hypothetical protein